MAKKKKKSSSLIEKAFGNDVDETPDMEDAADEGNEAAEVLDEEQVSTVLDQAEVQTSPDVKPKKESIQKEKKPKASKVRGKDMKFGN